MVTLGVVGVDNGIIQVCVVLSNTVPVGQAVQVFEVVLNIGVGYTQLIQVTPLKYGVVLGQVTSLVVVFGVEPT